MFATPKISIIIPVYNREGLIIETLNSIRSQDYQNWECIIVDDGSVDQTKSVIQKFIEKDDRYILLDRPNHLPKGANSCRNYGFEKASGEFVNWFDSDDIVLPNFLSEKIKHIAKELDLIIATGYITDENLLERRGIEVFETDYIFKDYIFWDLKIMTPSVLFRKSFLMGKELFSHKILKGQEGELFSRLFFKMKPSQYKIINVPTFLYRFHEGSSTTRNKEYREDFKESESYTLMRNLERAVSLQDRVILNRMYKLSILLLYKGTIHGHDKNIEYIMNHFKRLLSEENKVMFGLLKQVVWMAKKIDISKTRWDYFFRRIPVK